MSAMRLYDVTGKLVSTLASGYHLLAGMASRPVIGHQDLVFASGAGIYLLKLETEGYTTTRKLIIE